MSQQLFLTLESGRNGRIEGSVTQAGFEDLIEVFSSSHEVSTDATLSGRRARSRNQHGAFTISKGVDKASVLLYDSWNTNDRINLLKLECYKTAHQGTLELFYTVELENARITSIKQQLANPLLSPLATVEEVSFAYMEIKWTFADPSLETSIRVDIGA